MTLVGGVPYTDAQVSVAKAIYDGLASYPEIIRIAAVANGDREVSLIPTLRGDQDTAGGLWQWHGDRRSLILQKTGADVWDGTVDSALKGFAYETGEGGEYISALAKMNDCTTPEDASQAWCQFYDVAGAADAISRSRTLATAWAAYFSAAPAT